MNSNFDIMKALENIDMTLSKALSITRNNYLADTTRKDHPRGTERELLFEYLAAISHAADALHMELRVEDHPEMIEGEHRSEEIEDDSIPF